MMSTVFLSLPCIVSSWYGFDYGYASNIVYKSNNDGHLSLSDDTNWDTALSDAGAIHGWDGA